MKKYPLNTATVGIALAVVFTVGFSVLPDVTLAQPVPCDPTTTNCPPPPAEEGRSWISRLLDFGTDILLAPLGWVAILILQLMNLFLAIAAKVFDLLMQYTVLDMSTHLSETTAIDRAWTSIRDIANMLFIFILLYAAIRTILGLEGNTKKLVVNVIVVAILINFSLFFTKIVIDASNVLATFFYNAAAGPQGTIGDRMLQELELGSLLDSNQIGAFDGKKLIIVGLFGSGVVLLATFIFIAAALMLAVRFVVLIFVLIFSPIAFMAFVFPALESLGKRWREALIGQAFFAPIYLLLTWVVINVSSALFAAPAADFPQAIAGVDDGTGNVQIGEMGIIMNFIIISALLVTSLIIAKSVSSRAGSGVAKANKLFLGAAIGTAAFAGRQTIGRYATGTAERSDLKERALAGDRSARLQLWAARKGSAASFDVRGAGLGVGGAIDAGKAGGKGGYAEFRKKQDEKAEKVAKSYGPTEVEIDQAKQALARAKEGGTEEERREAQARVDRLVGIKGGKEGKKEIAARKEDLEKRRQQALKNDVNLQSLINKELDIEEQIRNQEREVSIAANPNMKREREMKLDELKTQLEKQKQASKALSSSITEAFDKEIEGIKETSSLAEKRKLAYASMVEKDFVPTILGYNKTAAAKIRAGKSKKDQAVEALRGLQEEGVIEGGAEKEEKEPETPPESKKEES